MFDSGDEDLSDIHRMTSYSPIEVQSEVESYRWDHEVPRQEHNPHFYDEDQYYDDEYDDYDEHLYDDYSYHF